MDGYVFTKNVVITNDQGGRCSVIFQILGGISDDSSGEDLVVFTDRCFARDVCMWAHDAVWPHFDVPIEDRVGSDRYS